MLFTYKKINRHNVDVAGVLYLPKMDIITKKKVGDFVLLPGVNEVSDSEWAGIKDSLKMYIAHGFITFPADTIYAHKPTPIKTIELVGMNLNELRAHAKELGVEAECDSLLSELRIKKDGDFEKQKNSPELVAFFATLKSAYESSQEQSKAVFTVESASLRDVQVAHVENIVANCFNIQVLNKWLKDETRDEVRVTLKNQIDSIEKKGRKQDN